MSEIKLLQRQFQMAHDWTLRLVEELDERHWKVAPEGLKTNINWQLGHLLVGLYYQALVCTGGSREGLKEQMPLSDYISLYRMGSQPDDQLEQKPGKAALLAGLQLTFTKVMEGLTALTDDALDEEVASKHPLAKTKREVLSWCTHHQMWHNGQISMLKRLLVGKSF